MGQVHANVAGVSIRRMSSWLCLRRSGYYEKKENENPDSKVRSQEYVMQLMKKIRRMQRAWGFRLIFAYMRKEGEKIGKNAPTGFICKPK